MTNNDLKVIKLEVDIDHAAIRLDVYLTKLLEKYSRSRIQSLISSKNVLVNEKVVKSSYNLKVSDTVVLNMPEDRPIDIEPENIPLNIVFEDDNLIIINKPPGMITHPAPGVYTGTLVNAILYHCKDTLSGINGYLRPGIVHRLDKDTSGLIIIAKNDFAHRSLASQIQERTVDKYYVAVIQGNFKEDEGIIDLPIDRHPSRREKMAVVEGGRESLTSWKILERYKVASLIEAKLHTGRTHQLRVHFSHLKHPILGDKVYGNQKALNINVERQALQAYKLSFLHPKTHEKLDFQIDFHDDIKRLINIFNKRCVTKEG